MSRRSHLDPFDDDSDLFQRGFDPFRHEPDLFNSGPDPFRNSGGPVISWSLLGDQTLANAYRPRARSMVSSVLNRINHSGNLGMARVVQFQLDANTTLTIRVAPGVTNQMVDIEIIAKPGVVPEEPLEPEEPVKTYSCPKLPVGDADKGYLFTEQVGIDYKEGELFARTYVTDQPDDVGPLSLPTFDLVEIGFPFKYDGETYTHFHVHSGSIYFYNDEDNWYQLVEPVHGVNAVPLDFSDTFFGPTTASGICSEMLPVFGRAWVRKGFVNWVSMTRWHDLLWGDNLFLNNPDLHQYVNRGVLAGDGVSQRYLVVTVEDNYNDQVDEIVLLEGGMFPDASGFCPPAIGFFYGEQNDDGAPSIFYPEVCSSGISPHQRTFIGLTDSEYKPMIKLHGDGELRTSPILTNKTFWFGMNGKGRPNGQLWPEDIKQYVYVFDKM